MGAKRRKPAAARSIPPGAAQAGPVEWAAVAWMLAAMTAGACLIVWFLVRAFVALSGQQPAGLRFGGLMLLAALVSGLVNLVLGAIVYRRKKTPVPRPILAFSLIVGLLPPLLVWLA